MILMHFNLFFSYLSNQLLYLSNNSWIHQSFFPVIHINVYLSIYLSFYWFTSWLAIPTTTEPNLSTNSVLWPLFLIDIHIYPSIYLSIYLFIFLLFYLLISNPNYNRAKFINQFCFMTTWLQISQNALQSK